MAKTITETEVLTRLAICPMGADELAADARVGLGDLVGILLKMCQRAAVVCEPSERVELGFLYSLPDCLPAAEASIDKRAIYTSRNFACFYQGEALE